MFYCFFKAQAAKKQRWAYFLLTGAILAGSLYTYDAARILVLFFGLWLIIEVFAKKTSIKKHFSDLTMMGLSFLVVILPLLNYALANWSNFTGRGNFLFIGHQIQKAGSLDPLWENLKTSLLLFNYRANGNDFFINEPLLDQPVSWFLPVGIVVAIIMFLKGKGKNYLFMLLFLLFFLIPGVLSSPNGNRAIGALPAVYFFSALGFSTFINYLGGLWKQKKSLIMVVATTVFLAVTTWVGYHNYLGPHRRELVGFYPEVFIALNHLQKIENRNAYDLYFSDRFPPELLSFFLYQPIKDNPFPKDYFWPFQSEEFLNVTPKPGRGIIFAMLDHPTNQVIANSLIKKFPRSQLIKLAYQNDNIQKPGSLLVIVPESNN